MWKTIRNATTNEILKTAFTPLSFTGITGAYSKLSMANYDGKVFSYWLDNQSANSTRTLTLPLYSNSTTLIGIFKTGDALCGFTSLTYTGTEAQPDLPVNAASLSGNQIWHMWMMVYPQTTNSLETTYKLYATNGHQNLVFDHWSDNGSTERIRTLTINEAT